MEATGHDDEDRELFQRARAGDLEAFETLLARHERSLYTLALRISRSREDAEDVVQETLLGAIEHLDGFREQARFRLLPESGNCTGSPVVTGAAVADPSLWGRKAVKCEELLRVLGEYVNGEIEPTVCKGFEAHLAGCDPCQVVIGKFRSTIGLYKLGQPYELPEAFRLRLHAAVRERFRRKFEGAR